MKLPIRILLLLAAVLDARVIDTSVKMVCLPENPSDCYPQLFEPTNEWQTVREGQQIPPGLHVRVNLETGLEEARILQGDDSSLSEVVIVDENSKQVDDFDLNSEAVKLKIQQTLKEHRERKKEFAKNKVSVSDLGDFDNSVEEVVGFQTGESSYRLEQALSTLADLSHDIEFGARLSFDPVVFHSMVALADEFLSTKEKIANPTNLRLSELIYRTMGSALRNNPEAVENVLEKQPASFVDGLFQTLSDPIVPEVIHKRVLGVVQALSSHRHFAYRYFNHDMSSNAAGLHTLISVFPNLGASSQVRIANIFEDLNLFPESTKREEVDESNVAELFSSYLQDILAEERSVDDEQMQVLFRSILELHSKRDIPVSKPFIQWLSKEAETRRASIRKKQSDSSENSFDAEMLRARHGIFGNPHARKDEL